MKRIIVTLFVLFPMLLNAGIILKRTGDKIEDVTIKSVTETEVVYIAVNGEETVILKNDVSAVLYDDGRYEEFKISKTKESTSNSIPETDADNQSANGKTIPNDAVEHSAQRTDNRSTNRKSSSDEKVYNIFAFGVGSLLFYAHKPQYDGAIVEYRIIYKTQSELPDFQYLGTTPFAYLTEEMFENELLSNNLKQYKVLNPLVVENANDVVRIEFRLSLNGYQTVVVKPLYFGGNAMLIPLQKLKIIK